jgi:hypothetical protein
MKQKTVKGTRHQIIVGLCVFIYQSVYDAQTQVYQHTHNSKDVLIHSGQYWLIIHPVSVAVIRCLIIVLGLIGFEDDVNNLAPGGGGNVNASRTHISQKLSRGRVEHLLRIARAAGKPADKVQLIARTTVGGLEGVFKHDEAAVRVRHRLCQIVHVLLHVSLCILAHMRIAFDSIPTN